MSPAGPQLGPYVVLDRLGAGGMGEVYLARDTRLEREVALKVLPRALTHDVEQLARFRREALALASLNHPNIATIHGLEESGGGAIVLVLERVEGESLAERLKRGPLPVEDALQVCAQIAEALEVAHERGLVHRDMKPANVMIGPRGLVKVLDFGLAKRSASLLGLREPPTGPDGTGELPGTPQTVPRLLAPDGQAPSTDAPLTAFGAVMGTPGYMSPEQVLAGEQDARTDIFAFGCVLYECLTGRRAFDTDDPFRAMAAVLHDSLDMTLLPERTPSRIRDLLVRCLEKNPESRLHEMRAARLEIEEALGIRRAAALREGRALATPHNLPTSTTSFVGRDSVIRECRPVLESSRLMTLTGMGGSGKTRLALRLAELELEAHPDGVWFVDLAPVTDPDRVPEVLAAALQLREEAGRALLQTVTDHLAARRVLLVLDNCEDVLAACGALATRLIHDAPGVRLLATSREALGVAGERVFAVTTLAVPDQHAGRDLRSIAGFEAVRLFVDRATLAQPSFELDAAQAPAVAEICRRLDGIPLAIELAAARVKVLGVEQIRSRLDDRFRLLASGSRTALPRQATLRATIQWSWDHLAGPEQELLRRLAVFAGGWTLERATLVSEESGDEFDILDLLTRLVEKSLVVVTRGTDGTARYRFLESVWRFALERLEESGELAAVRERHVAAYLALAEESERHLTGPKQAEWVADLAHEQENLLAALAACVHVAGGEQTAIRLAGSVCRFWSAQGQYELGRRALTESLKRDVAAAPTPARAKALVRAGGFALYQGDYAAARPAIEESLAIYRTLGDRKGVARALSGLGVVATYQSNNDEANAIGEESLAIYRELGEKRGVGVSLHNLGFVAWCRGRLDESRARYEEALALMREVGDEEMMALTLSGLGIVDLKLGDRDGARARFVPCLELVKRLGARREGVYAIEGIAALALMEGKPGVASRLMGAAEAIREKIGSPALPTERAELERMARLAREALGAAEMAAETGAGRALSFEAALTEAATALGAPPRQA